MGSGRWGMKEKIKVFGIGKKIIKFEPKLVNFWLLTIKLVLDTINPLDNAKD